MLIVNSTRPCVHVSLKYMYLIFFSFFTLSWMCNLIFSQPYPGYADDEYLAPGTVN